MALLCTVSLLVVAVAFGAPWLGPELSEQVRLALIALGADLHRRPGDSDRGRRDPSRRARHQRIAAGAVLEPDPHREQTLATR